MRLFAGALVVASGGEGADPGITVQQRGIMRGASGGLQRRSNGGGAKAAMVTWRLCVAQHINRWFG